MPYRVGPGGVSPLSASRELFYPSSGLPSLLSQKAGAFVTIKRAETAGCIGTIEPVKPNLAEEISYNAVSAGLRIPGLSR